MVHQNKSLILMDENSWDWDSNRPCAGKVVILHVCNGSILQGPTFGEKSLGWDLDRMEILGIGIITTHVGLVG